MIYDINNQVVEVGDRVRFGRIQLDGKGNIVDGDVELIVMNDDDLKSLREVTVSSVEVIEKGALELDEYYEVMDITFSGGINSLNEKIKEKTSWKHEIISTNVMRDEFSELDELVVLVRWYK